MQGMRAGAPAPDHVGLTLAARARHALSSAWRLAPIGVFVAFLVWKGGFFVLHPQALFGDAHLYFRATVTWLQGGDPWSATDYMGIAFAAPPPALLLNLPLVPFGEDVAAWFWPVAGIAGVVLAIRRYKLPLWWLIFPPFVEGVLSGSPDPMLLGAMLLGGGAITGLTKPYAVPSMIGERRYRSLIGAAVIGLVTLPLLPWSSFFAALPHITENLAGQALAGQALSKPVVYGPATLLVAVAVVLLRWRGWLVATPALWPSPQLHYATFSIEIARHSTILAIGFSLPGLAPVAVVVYSFGQLALGRLPHQWRPHPGVASGGSISAPRADSAGDSVS